MGTAKETDFQRLPVFCLFIILSVHCFIDFFSAVCLQTLHFISAFMSHSQSSGASSSSSSSWEVFCHLNYEGIGSPVFISSSSPATQQQLIITTSCGEIVRLKETKEKDGL